MKANEIVCDVLVVGAGVSGVAAAVAASGKGAKTVLLEQNSYIGGTVITGMHRYLCGLYNNTTSKTINDGIAAKLVSKLKRLSSRNKPLRQGKVYVFSFRREDLAQTLRSLIRNKENLKVILENRVYSVQKEKGRIIAVQAKGNKMVISIKPKVVIDASGEGDVIKLSGAKYRISPVNKRQLAGFSFRLKGLKDVNELLSIKVPYYIKFATFTPLANRDEGVIRLNITAKVDTDGIRKKVFKIFRYLRKVLPEFKDAYIVEFSPYTVEREGVCLRGEYTLTASDVLRGRRFKDGAVKNSWPIEMWDQKKGPQYRYLKSGQYYEIPLRCLKSKNIKNLLACGRCISVTHEALGSTRAAGTCIALGEQAGIAASKLCAYY
jgi:flavin-dependent dehydrogenase